MHIIWIFWIKCNFVKVKIYKVDEFEYLYWMLTKHQNKKYASCMLTCIFPCIWCGCSSLYNVFLSESWKPAVLAICSDQAFTGIIFEAFWPGNILYSLLLCPTAKVMFYVWASILTFPNFSVFFIALFPRHLSLHCVGVFLPCNIGTSVSGLHFMHINVTEKLIYNHWI